MADANLKDDRETGRGHYRVHVAMNQNGDAASLASHSPAKSCLPCTREGIVTLEQLSLYQRLAPIDLSDVSIATIALFDRRTDCCHRFSLVCDLTTEEVRFSDTQNGNDSSAKDRDLNDAQEHSYDTVDALQFAYGHVGAFDGLIEVLGFGLPSPLPVDL